MSHKYVRIPDDTDQPAVPILVEELEGEDTYRVTIGERSYELEAYATEGRIVMLRDGRSVDLPVEKRGDKVRVQLAGGYVEHDVMDERTYKLQLALGQGPGAFKPELISPMAGKIVQVEVSPGDRVEENQTLLIIEAMKMENEVRAEAEAIVKAVHVAAGETIESGTVLLEFEEAE